MADPSPRRRAHWVVRAGEENRLVDEFIDSGVTGVGYFTIPDGTDLTYTEVRRMLVDEATSEALDLHTSMFIEFVREISIGHVILMPDTPRREMVVGSVTGPYEFHPDLPPERYRHRRTVEWFGRVSLTDLPAGGDKLYRQRSTLTRASIPGLEEFTDRVRAGEIGRPATARTRAPARSTARRSRSAAPPKPPPVVRERLCPGCGMIKHVAQFGPEGVCVDCA
jgi:predicted Mrr-cat superfamily restriction endonuclease